MKNTSLIILVAITLSLTGCENASSPVTVEETIQNVETQNIEDGYKTITIGGLSDAEKEGLIFMREEEKLARDVYLHFSDKYGVRIFSNIAKSEGVHMATLKMLLDKYNLEDPILDDAVGAFQNEKLAGLYTQLTEAGDVSLVEALKMA